MHVSFFFQAPGVWLCYFRLFSKLGTNKFVFRPCSKRELTCSRPPTNRRGQRKKGASDGPDESGTAQSHQQQTFDSAPSYVNEVANLSINDPDRQRPERASSASSSEEASPLTPSTPYK